MLNILRTKAVAKLLLSMYKIVISKKKKKQKKNGYLLHLRVVSERSRFCKTRVIQNVIFKYC